jgi:hypothetical protein
VRAFFFLEGCTMPFDILSRTSGLADTAYADLATLFAFLGHTPSSQQWAAISDLLEHLQQAADGQLPPALYVSTIPAGTGKSQSIAAFARALLDDPGRTHAGMLILVNRIVEAKDMAEAIGAEYRDKLCVITSDHNVNDLGAHAEAAEAQVCIATQAALKSTLKRTVGGFSAASRFHYRGGRRALVAWDEAFTFNRPVVLDADTVLGLVRAMRRQSNGAADTLKRWSADLDGLAGLIDVPDFEGLGIDFQRLEDEVGDRDDLVAQVKALAVVSGDRGYVSRQGPTSAVITHYPEIPRSLMPVVVTDASARVNRSYTQMARKVPVKWLKDAPKTYDDLTIRVVSTAASRSVYRDMKTHRGRALLDAFAGYIRSLPAGEEVLVIGYKGWFAMKGVAERQLHKALLARLTPEDQARVHYLEYGRHTATNDYKQVKHVVLMGLNFIPRAASHAACGAALDLDLKGEHPTEHQIAAMERGLLMDSTLQALLRGHARVSVNGGCGEMEAIIPMAKRTGLSQGELQMIFPGAAIVEDTVLMPPKPLKGRLADLDAIVRRRLEAGETEMTNASLYAELKMAKSNFHRLVSKKEWQARLAQLGLNPQPLKGREMGLRLVA